jgi:AraC family transcriptional regulator
MSTNHFNPQHNGEIIESKSIAGFHLTETAYAPGIKVPRHSHLYACFCFILQGSYTEHYGQKAIDCLPSHLLFRPAEEMHSDHFGDRDVRCFIIEVENDWLLSLRERSIRFEEPASFQGASLAWLMRRLRSEAEQVDDFTSLTIEGLMLEMGAEIARRSVRTHEGRHPRWLKQAMEILHDKFTEPTSVSDIAASVGVHPVYLASAFRKHNHCTIGEYVRGLRIEFASHELSRTSTPIIDIALAAGFSHQSHFSRTFKRLTGATPAEYRSANRSS